MTGWLPAGPADLFGPDATADESYDLLTVDIPVDTWPAALTTARDTLGCAFFDWLSAVDEPGTGFRICAHVVGLRGPGTAPDRLLLRTLVPHRAPELPTATTVYPGAAWHERETREMFGVTFTGHPDPAPLLLPDTFEGHPLRKDFVLAARVVKAWPGAKEPGESGHGAPRRRQMLPPGVPDPNEWGPLKGRMPDAPPPRRRGAARRAGTGASDPQAEGGTSTTGGGTGGGGAAPEAAASTAGDGDTTPGEGGDRRRPARRTRSASDGSASQRRADRPPRRARSASDGSASQRGPGPTDPPAGPPPDPSPDASPDSSPSGGGRGSGQGGPRATGTPGRRSTDAPWHTISGSDTDPGTAEAGAADGTDPGPDSRPDADTVSPAESDRPERSAEDGDGEREAD